MEGHADTPNSWKEIIIKKACQPPFMEDQTHLTLGENEPSTIYAGKTREGKQAKQ